MKKKLGILKKNVFYSKYIPNIFVGFWVAHERFCNSIKNLIWNSTIQSNWHYIWYSILHYKFFKTNREKCAVPMINIFAPWLVVNIVQVSGSFRSCQFTFRRMDFLSKSVELSSIRFCKSSSSSVSSPSSWPSLAELIVEDSSVLKLKKIVKWKQVKWHISSWPSLAELIVHRSHCPLCT